jgi:hypothetical protein
MPSLDKHQSSEFTKLLLEGDSGSGKTGSLASLVAAGFKLRILDMDNGLDSLANAVKRTCPANLGNVEFRTLRDKRRATAAGPVIDGVPSAFTTALQMLDRWKYNEIDLGVPATWGADTWLVLDSLTFLADAAFDWREALTKSATGGKYDKRMVYYDAQNAVENVLALLTGESFRTNVIVITHIRYTDNPDGTKKGYPTAVGSALGPTIPRYFNSVALCQTAAGGKRTIQTVATAMIDLKNPASAVMKPSLPIETGLAEFVKTLRS